MKLRSTLRAIEVASPRPRRATGGYVAIGQDPDTCEEIVWGFGLTVDEARREAREYLRGHFPDPAALEAEQARLRLYGVTLSEAARIEDGEVSWERVRP